MPYLQKILLLIFYLLFGLNLEFLLLLIPPNHDIMKFNTILELIVSDAAVVLLHR